MASLYWGRSRQQVDSLQRQLEKQAEEESLLSKKLEALSMEHQAQSVTCHTLEEELARIATEQEAHHAEATQARTDRTRLRRYESECVELTEKLEALKEKTLAETSSLEDSLRAAENRARQVAKEKEELLDLVGKLQSKLDQIAPLQRRLLHTEKRIQSAQQETRSVQIKSKRRALRRLEESGNTPRNRANRSQRHRQTFKDTTAPKSEPTSQAEPKPINGTRSTGSTKQRFLTAASKLLPKGSDRSRRHW